MKHVDLHWIDLDDEAWQNFPSRELLTEDERTRVDRMIFAHDRRRCLVGWAARRLILARALGCQPDRLRFLQESEGRPYLEDRPLDFNLSHSGTRAVLAITPFEEDLMMGVDVESNSRTVELEPLSRRFFHPLEVEHLRGENFSAAVFFRIWTAKESYLKALGTGLRKALDSFNVVSADGEWRLCEPPGERLAGWSAHSFRHAQIPDFQGCLTVNREQVAFYQHLFILG